MKISLSWLNEFADFGSDDNVISERLTELGLAVESVEYVGEPVKGVVTAKVLRLEKHPDAAKVTRVFVDAGDGVERHVWCGATNMIEGDVSRLQLLALRCRMEELFLRGAFSASIVRACCVRAPRSV